MHKKILTSILLLSIAIISSAKDNPLWLRSSAISPDGEKIAFTYKGDIYIVDREGGKAQQITTNPAYDSTPLWTPDGKEIVFSSYREKSKDIYKVSAEGGAPLRMTSHPGNETPKAVLKDGSIVFCASIQQDSQYGDFPEGTQLYTVSPDGGCPSLVTSLQIENLSVRSDNTIIYEDYKGYEDPWRKHHTSSVTHDIWMYTPTSKSSKQFGISPDGTFSKLTDFKGEDRNPLFSNDGDRIYYLSEQDGTFNIYTNTLDKKGKPEQLTFHRGNPVRYLSVSNNDILCYSYDGELYTLQQGKKPRKVNIYIATDQIESPAQDRTLTSGATSLAVSPEGKEIAIIVRGDLFVTSVDHKTTKRITNTPEQERNVCFSKDGRTLYYSSERNGHWGIWKTSLRDKNDKMFTYAIRIKEELVTKPGETCFQPQISPDGESLAYLKDRTAIAIMDLKTGKEKIILDKSVNYSYKDGDQEFAWSPDSRYILCNYQANGGWNNEDVALIDTKTGEITDLTESGYNDGSFRWALKGKAMTWTSDKAGYRSHGSWGAEKNVYIMFFDGKKHAEFIRDKEAKEIAEMRKAAEVKKEEKDTVDTNEKKEETVLDLADRKDRIIKLTKFSGRLGDHYLTQNGKTLYYLVRLEKGTDLCKVNLEDNSISVVSKGVQGKIFPTSDDKYLYVLSNNKISKISTSNGKSESISFSASAPTPVVGSVTSCRNLRLRYVSASAISATYGSFHVVSHQIRCFAGAASSACVLSPVAAPSATGAIATAATTRIFAIRMYCLIYRLQVSQRHRREASFCQRALCGRRL